jgi:hypothetical protein
MADEANRQITVIPALPGWYVALYIEAGESDGKKWEDGLALTPIIAWEIEKYARPYHHSVKNRRGELCVSRFATPITPSEDVEHIVNLWCLKTPDETYIFPHDRDCDSLEDALTEFRQQVTARSK